MARYSWLLLKLIGWDKLQITVVDSVLSVHLCRCKSRMLEGRGGFFISAADAVASLRQIIYWLLLLLLLFDSELYVVVNERCFLGAEG